MYAKRIIPCLDVKNGRVVKGVSFVNLRDAGDPVQCAVEYDKKGADELVLLDITATNDGRGTMLDIVSRVANSIFIPFTVGGGIRSTDDFKELLRAGADKISVNSAAVRNPDLINDAAYKFGSQCVVCAIDAKRTDNGKWEVYLNGGRIPTGIDAVLWATEAEKRGAGERNAPHAVGQRTRRNHGRVRYFSGRRKNRNARYHESALSAVYGRIYRIVRRGRVSDG